MKSRWSALALLTLLPFGAALADYADQSRPPVPVLPQRSVEHESLVESAEQAVSAAARTARELAVAIENARRSQDMLLVTCLTDARETVRGAQADAMKTLTAMGATKNVEQARGLVPQINRTNQLLNSTLQNAASCEGDEEDESGVKVTVDELESSTTDPGFDGPGGLSPIAPPPTSVPPGVPPTVDVMEPGTDVPMTPPTASPMR